MWKSLLLLFFLTSCAETRIYYRDGALACAIQSDCTDVTFRSGDVYFHADTLIHSEPTAAAYGGATKMVGGVGSAVAGALLTVP